jgi:uncharacterized integral membrane protein
MLKPFLPLFAVLVVVILVTAFALMNRTEVAVWLFGWRWWLPLVWVILGAFTAGVAVGAGLSLKRQFDLAARLEAARRHAAAPVAVVRGGAKVFSAPENGRGSAALSQTNDTNEVTVAQAL